MTLCSKAWAETTLLSLHHKTILMIFFSPFATLGFSDHQRLQLSERFLFVCFLMSFSLPFLNSRMMLSSEKNLSIKVTDMVCHFNSLWRFQQPLLKCDFSMWLASTGLSSISSFHISIQLSSYKYSGILDRWSIYSLPKPPEKAMAPRSSTLAWKIPWTEEPGGLQSMGLLRVRHDWGISLSLLTFMHWRRKWQPTTVFLPGEFQGRGSLVGCRLWGRTESDTTEAT